MKKETNRLGHKADPLRVKGGAFIVLLGLGVLLSMGCGTELPEEPATLPKVKTIAVSSGQGLAGQSFPGKVRPGAKKTGAG